MSKDFRQYGHKPPEDRTEAEGRQLRLRSGLLIFLFAAVLAAYGMVLYDIQIVHGDDYQQQASYTTVQWETVDSVRGEILDSRGRVLVSNTFGYEVTLDTSVMDDRQMEILSELIALSMEEGVEWTDNLPISAAPPYSFTRADVYTWLRTQTVTGDDGEETTQTEVRLTNLGSLAVKSRYKWISDPLMPEEERVGNEVFYLTAQRLLEEMCKSFGVELPKAEEGETPYISPETRALVGVLYELALRRNDVLYSEYVFTRDVDITFISKVKERGLTGVVIESVASRQYNTTYAAHVLGRTGKFNSDEMWQKYKELGYAYDASVGLSGAELAFEEYLHGTSGSRSITTSDSGKITSQEWEAEPQPGGNVTLTLDIGLQTVMENSLASHVQSLDPELQEGAAMVALDMTGGVLAMASYPTYDLATYSQNSNELNSDPNKPLLNRAASGTYAPGSTFKLLTATAGLMEGIINPREYIFCGGSYTYEGWKNFRAFCLRRSGHGRQNLVNAIKNSCNVYFYDVGRRVGITKLNEYAAQFGLGQHTGIETGDAAGEVAGPETSARHEQVWNEGSTVYAAIGQENNQITPLQLANYIATLVNGGDHYAVHLLQSVKSHDYSQTLYEYEPELLNTIDIPEDALAAMKEGMYQVTQNAALARYFNTLPVKAGAKTGTAETTGGTDNKNTNGVLVVFAPLDEPQIALCIVMEHASTGGSLASIAADVLNYYFTSDASLTNVPQENTLIQ